jgi:hypothetical protein
MINDEKVRLNDQLIEQGIQPSKVPATVDKMLRPFQQKIKDQYFEAIETLKEKK